MPSAVIDLTEMVRLAMQRPGQSRLFQAWESRAFIWVTSEQMLTELVEVTNRPRLQRMIRPIQATLRTGKVWQFLYRVDGVWIHRPKLAVFLWVTYKR